MRRYHFKLKFSLPNTITLLNAMAGYLAIIFATSGRIQYTAALLFLGVVLDSLDGKLARFLHKESRLGKQLDSLSDMITFGLAPAVVTALVVPSLLSLIAGGLFVFSAALRLAKFNIQEDKKMFHGVPTTVNGVLFPIFLLWGPLVVLPYYLFGMAFLMNAPFRMKKV